MIVSGDIIDKAQLSSIKDNLKKLWTKRKNREESSRKAAAEAASRATHLEDYTRSDGEAVITIIPSDVGSDGRKSSRTRRMRIYGS